MGNYLEVNMQETINTLHAKGWSKRRIAKELDINRRTVGRYIKNTDSKCTIVTTGSGVDLEGVTKSKCTIVTTGAVGGKSLCLGYHDYILKQIEQDLSAQRIYQDLVSDFNFQGSYQSVKRYVRRISESV